MDEKNIAYKLWETQPNYKVIELRNSTGNCCVFCSSNGIKPQNDYFEWENIAKNKSICANFDKLIFLRDVFCKSYINGINKDINCIDKIITLIKKLVSSKSAYFCGNSAGAYLACILGCSIPQTKRILSFGGIFSLYQWKGSHNNDFNLGDIKEYSMHIGDYKYERYFEIYNLLSNDSKCLILHFYSSKNQADRTQLLGLPRQDNFGIFGMDSSVHGGGVNFFDVPKLLTSSDSHIKKLIGKYSNKESISKDSFSIYNLGLVRYLFEQAKRFTRRIKKKKHQAV